MSSAPTPSEIAADATWLAQALDPVAGLVRYVRMTQDSYRSASFLDDRLLQSPVEQHVLDWAGSTSAIAAGPPADVRWIFHIGHVGSTLLSRLLGELVDVLAVREPRFLRDLALAEAPAKFTDIARHLLGRTFSKPQIAIVKATSFVSEIAAELIGPSGRAIFVHASPRAYIGTILAGENSLIELATLEPLRRARMTARVRLDAYPDRPAYKAAAAWACEMTALEAAADEVGGERIHWLDFDRLLADVPASLGNAAGFLELRASPDQLLAIGNGPLLRRYSKALEYDYSPALRQELIAEALAANASDLAGALAMLRSAAQDSPLLARALNRTEAEI